jgi:hypothetical protein
MTLNSSGPISLGGSTTGQSINLELGFSATALASINSTSFRTLAGVASGAISLSNFYGKSNTSAFWVLISNTSGATTLYLGGQYVTANGSFIVNQAQNSSSTNSMNIYKISGNGSLTTSSKLITTGGSSPIGTGSNVTSALVVDSSCNIYTNNSGTLTKTNPTASSYSAFTYSYGTKDPLVFDGTYLYSPLIYINGPCCGCSFSGWAKYNTSLSPQGITTSANYQFSIFSLAYDGGTGLYTGHGQSYISKFNTSFTFLWCYGTPGSYVPSAIGANSANSTIAISSWTSGATYISMSSVATVNSSTKPTFNYRYTLGSSGSQNPNGNYLANCIDSSNNAYHLVGVANNPYGYILIKINSSGTVQWQRSFTIYYSGGSAPFTNFGHPFISVENNFVHFSAFITNGSPNAIFYIQYPTDGSKTGTYGLINNCQLVISTSSITLTSNGITWGSYLNFTTQNLSNSSSSYSSGSSGSATDSFFYTTL